MKLSHSQAFDFMARMLYSLLVATFLAVSGLSPARAVEPVKITFSKEPLTIRTSRGDLKFNVEMAITPEQQERGLMYRSQVPEGTGMLFVLPRPEDVHMWMRDTPATLDMLFIDERGFIVHIAHMAEPFSDKELYAGRPVKAVLELPGGDTARFGILKGDFVMQRALGT